RCQATRSEALTASRLPIRWHDAPALAIPFHLSPHDGGGLAHREFGGRCRLRRGLREPESTTHVVPPRLDLIVENPVPHQPTCRFSISRRATAAHVHRLALTRYQTC